MVKTFKINNRAIKYKPVYRKVRYPRLEYRTGELVLILPKGSNSEKEILNRHKRWIYKKDKEIKKALKDINGKKLNMKMDRRGLRKFANRKAKVLSNKFKIKLDKIIIRKMKTKWASLSSRRNITLNSYSKYLPEELIEYIIFHEVSHLKVRKHNDKFWRLIEKQYSNYKKCEEELFKYWFLLQREINNLQGGKNEC